MNYLQKISTTMFLLLNAVGVVICIFPAVSILALQRSNPDTSSPPSLMRTVPSAICEGFDEQVAMVTHADVVVQEASSMDRCR